MTYYKSDLQSKIHGGCKCFPPQSFKPTVKFLNCIVSKTTATEKPTNQEMNELQITP